MNKIGAVIIVVGVVALAYLLILLVMPVFTDIVSSANVSMANATANFTGVYPGTSELMVSTPWIAFFIPGAIGMALIIMILKKP